MGRTTHSGPLRVGDGDEAGAVMLEKRVVLTQNSTTAVTGTILLPDSATITSAYIDNLTVWDSVTSATGSIGTAAAGTQYGASLNAKTAGRQLVTYTSANLLAMANIGANTLVYFTVTPVGATTAGLSHGVLHYKMN